MDTNTSSVQHRQVENSLVYRLDPRVKVVTAFLLITGIIVTPDYAWVAYPLLWTLIGSLAALSHLSAWRLGWRASLALPFTMAAITLLITTPGKPVLSAAGLSITDAGLAKFLGIVLKSWLSTQVALLLALTTKFADILTALRALGVSEMLIATISIMHRYLLTIKDEAERLLRARAARSGTKSGVKPRGNLFWRAQITGGMVGNLFLRSYERSERVYAAMLARGYNGHIKYQDMPPLTWQAAGWGILPVIIVVVIQIVVRL